MPGIVIQSIFDVMQGAPIDSRLVAYDANERLSINYLYAGLKVYQTDVNRTYTYNGSTWDVEGSGIYGGSGSIVNDTTVGFGTVSDPSLSKSYELVYQADTTGTSKSFLYNYFHRHTIATSGLQWKDIEFRHQYKYLDNSGNLKNSAYISLNPLNPNSTQPGAISFHTGFDTNLSEKMRISWDGKVGIGTNNPREFLQIATTSSPTSAPLVFHNAGSAVIGHNWYFSSNTDQYFDVTKASTKIVQSSGSFVVQNRPANTTATNYIDTLFTVGTNGGRVGIRNILPTTALDVTGEILGLTVSSSNRVQARSYNFSALVTGSTPPAPTSIYTISQGSGSALVVRAGGTSSFVSDGNFNYFTPKSNFFDDVSIAKDLYVVENTTIDGNLTVTGTSSITNFEPSSNLIPLPEVYFYDSLTFSSTNQPNLGVDPVTLNNFTYSITAYRVGALVHLNVYLESISDFQTGTTLKGIMIGIDNERFKPTKESFDSAFGGRLTNLFYPLSLEVFQQDVTGGSAPSLIGTNQFWIRFRTLDGVSGYNFDSTSTVQAGAKFRGTITYKVGSISSGSSPTPPPTTAPGGSGGGPSAL